MSTEAKAPSSNILAMARDTFLYELDYLLHPLQKLKGFNRFRYMVILPFLTVYHMAYLLILGLLSIMDLILSPIQRALGTTRMAYFFILPNMLVFGIFVLLPMVLNFYIGFTSGQSIRVENRDWVGTQNLERLMDCENFTDPNTCREDFFWNGVRNTVFFVSIQVASMVILALFTAISLNGKILFRGFFRSVFFYPVLLSPVVVALIWKWMLDAESGIINYFLVQLGFERVNFLIDRNWARFWVIVVSDWAQMGFYTLILLAGLQSIPASLYEAADMDGANAVSKFRYVTLPLLVPTMTVVLVLALIRAVQVFDQVFVLTGGGPGTATFYIVQYIYRNGFGITPAQYGLASAASLLLASVLLILTLGQLWLARRNDTV